MWEVCTGVRRARKSSRAEASESHGWLGEGASEERPDVVCLPSLSSRQSSGGLSSRGQAEAEEVMEGTRYPGALCGEGEGLGWLMDLGAVRCLRTMEYPVQGMFQ